MPFAAAAGAGVLSAGIGAFSASQAADAQEHSANEAANVQRNSLAQVMQDIQPWLSFGSGAGSALRDLTSTDVSGVGQTGYQNAASSPLLKPFDIAGFNTAFNTSLTNPSVTAGNYGTNNPLLMSGYAIDPSFNFTLDQGLNGILNRASATGGAISGNTLKALQGYGQGLLSQNYWNDLQNNYNLYTGNQGNMFNRLFSLSGQGVNAATNTASPTIAGANGIANSITQGGNANAAGIAGVGNALSGGANSIAQMYMLNNLINGGGGGAGPNFSQTIDASGNVTL